MIGLACICGGFLEAGLVAIVIVFGAFAAVIWAVVFVTGLIRKLIGKARCMCSCHSGDDGHPHDDCDGGS